MEIVIESLRADWEAFLRVAPRFLYGIVIAIIFLTIAKYSRRAAGRILLRANRSQSTARFFEYLTGWIVASIGVLLALGTMGFHGVATSLLATGGVAAIVLGFAFREVGENLLAGLFLTISRPFEVGDLIKTGDIFGEVRSLEFRYIHVRTYDACDVFVPSAQLFRQPLYNYTKDRLRRPSFTIGVAYHDEPNKVISLLEKVAADAPDVLATPRPFVSVKDFAGPYIEYEVFFWIDIKKSEQTYVAAKNTVKIHCWRALREANMTFSTDVTTSLDIKAIPAVAVALSET